MIENDQQITQNINHNNKHIMNIIRPKSFDDYIGQKLVVNQMKIFIKAANARSESLDHVLIYGLPGLGKTTLAHIISNTMNVNIRSTSGPVLEKAGDLVAILTNLEHRDVLFIDEIHRLSPHVEEILYPAMEDQNIDIMIGEGPSAQSIKIHLPSFTLIGATTRSSALTSPLFDRFGIIQRLEFYSTDELKDIIQRTSNVFKFNLHNDGAFEIAKRSRGTPRIANRLLRRVRDFAEVQHKSNMITKQIVINALNMLNIDNEGFDLIDRKIILTIINKFNGGPVGLNSLATAVGEDASTIEEVLEPFLIQKGFIQRTSRGRIATENALKYFAINMKK